MEAVVNLELTMLARGDDDLGPAPSPKPRRSSYYITPEDPPQSSPRTWVADSQLAYHSYAGAKRVLCAMMPECKCEPMNAFAAKHAYCVYSDGEGRPVCKRAALARSIELFQRRGYGGVRYNTIIAMNGRLPAELFESIFKFTMAAEDMPLDPRVFKTRKVWEACTLHHDLRRNMFLEANRKQDETPWVERSFLVPPYQRAITKSLYRHARDWTEEGDPPRAHELKLKEARRREEAGEETISEDEEEYEAWLLLEKDRERAHAGDREEARKIAKEVALHELLHRGRASPDDG